MQNEVLFIYYQENKTGSDSNSLGQCIGGNVMREILSRHRILAEKTLKSEKTNAFWTVRAKMF